MYAIAFPNIFNGSTVNLYSDYTAVKSNLKNLLSSNKGGLFGDPAFGTKIKPILWDQEAIPVLKELITDEIYEAIYSYMPQIEIQRSNIKVDIRGTIVSITIKVTNNPDITSDMFQIDLLKDEDF